VWVSKIKTDPNHPEVLVPYQSFKAQDLYLVVACVGLLLSFIGLDNISGLERFTYGIPTLEDGIGLVPVAVGVFGLGEVLSNIQESVGKREIFHAKISNLFPVYRKHHAPGHSCASGRKKNPGQQNI